MQCNDKHQKNIINMNISKQDYYIKSVVAKSYIHYNFFHANFSRRKKLSCMFTNTSLIKKTTTIKPSLTSSSG